MSDRHQGIGRETATRRAGLSDVRTVIGLLVGFYGIVLILMGLFADSAADRAKTGDVNANLWAGLGMLVFGLLFVLWAWLRPVLVKPEEIEPPHGGRVPPVGPQPRARDDRA
jgi:hypothetical protein